MVHKRVFVLQLLSLTERLLDDFLLVHAHGESLAGRDGTGRAARLLHLTSIDLGLIQWLALLKIYLEIIKRG